MLLSNSKIYKYSKNKAAIKAAIQNPINSELVMQLSEQLSDDTIEELLEIRVEGTKEPAEDGVEPDLGSTVEDGEVSTQVNVQDTDQESDRESVEESEGGNSKDIKETVVEPKPDETVVQSIGESHHSYVNSDFSKSIVSSVSIDSPISNILSSGDLKVHSDNPDIAIDKSYVQSCVRPAVDYQAMAKVVQGTLNMNALTSGVDKATVEDGELFLYYSPKISIDSVMADAIRLISASSYTYLEFNRVIRNENALVFKILGYCCG